MRFRGMYLVVLALTLLIGALSAAQATVISRDVAYWYWNEPVTGGPRVLDTWFNPNSRWLRDHRRALVIKVQQTVYDEKQTEAILRANLPKPTVQARTRRAKSLKANSIASTAPPVIPQGFLFSYAVTNLNWREPMGMTGFAVDWGSVPVVGGIGFTSRTQTPSAWEAYVPAGNPVNGPAWRWTNPSRPGLRVGSTVGGFWAVSPTGTDGVVNAWAGSAGAATAGLTWTLKGKTTGPIPEPGTAVTLVVGAAVMGVFRLRRRAN